MKVQFFLGCLFLLPIFQLSALTPSWYQHPVDELRLWKSQTVTAGGIYSSPTEKIVVNPAMAAERPQFLELVFEKEPHITATTFEVAAGGRLIFRNCRLNRVCLICQPGGEIRLEGCAMMQVYFSANNGYGGTAKPAPKIVLEESAVHFSAIDSPMMTGLTAKNCKFISCELNATEKDGANTVSSISQCYLAECKLHAAEVLMCSSNCWFYHCICLGEFPSDLGSYLPKPVLVQLEWNGLNPPSLPTQAGKVHFQGLKSIEALLGLARAAPEAASSGAPGRHLMEFLTLVDAEGKKASAVQASRPPSRTPTETAITSFVSASGAFKSRQTNVNGLLIAQLAGGEAGQVTRMSLTALPSLGGSSSTLKFNQSVGKDMEKALNEVSKFSQLRHSGWPAGHQMEIGFEDKYVAKDGPSAAVACALLLEAAITGKKWDPVFAVTGDMNADGSVQPIGGVQAKIRGATKGACKIVGVPVKNEKAVADILVMDGPAPLVGITIFGIKTFEDAMLLSDPERPQALQNALTDFDNMRTVMMRDPRQIVPLLRTPQAAQRLQTLLAAAPNCYSAKYLLLYLQGRAPRTLSIGGSIEAAQNSADSIVAAIDHDVDTNMSSLKGDELGSSLNKLRNLRPLLDQRVWPYVDGLISYGEVIRGSVLNPVRSGARYSDLVTKANLAAGSAKAAYTKLLGDVQVREELGL
ncbi:S16 family serine protease [Prosthecobacter sp.]|uniref:S16 family serine protease n=1 Tax=Prosthecobacter sp. TaxID=1965333 RepID=UPI002AB824A7|nr:S16 family serine protease [Prosthecobacter sp.]MDZ4402318.1 S16 family serine protease [Prosthecobacter sp.]